MNKMYGIIKCKFSVAVWGLSHFRPNNLLLVHLTMLFHLPTLRGVCWHGGLWQSWQVALLMNGNVLGEVGRGVYHRSVWLLARRNRAAGKRGHVTLHIVSHSMKKSFLGKLMVTSSDRQEIPRILCDPRVHCRFHNSTPMVPILSQILYPWYPSVIYDIFVNCSWVATRWQ